MMDYEKDTQRVMIETGLLDTSADLIVLLLLIITFNCLLKTMSYSPTQVKISIAYCVIILLIIIHDMGFTLLTLWIALVEEEVEFILNYPVLFKISLTMTALKIYARFVLILLHLVVSINRAYAVFKPLQYSKTFTPRKTTATIIFVFVLCVPVFFIYTFRLFRCEYFFDPEYFSWSYTKNRCHRTYIIVNYLLSVFVLFFSIIVDAFVTIYLFRSRKNRRLLNDKINFQFMIQTLILSSANGIFTIYLHTVGKWNFFNPWIDHIAKFMDIFLAFVYVMCIAFLNNAVRAEVLYLLNRRNKNCVQGTIVTTVCSRGNVTLITSHYLFLNLDLYIAHSSELT